MTAVSATKSHSGAFVAPLAIVVGEPRTQRIAVILAANGPEMQMATVMTNSGKFRLKVASSFSATRATTSLGLMACAIMVISVLSLVIGIFWSGPVTGALLPISLTIWWLFSRFLSAYRI